VSVSVWIDRKYVLLLSPKLEQFKQKNTNLFSFRCCYCGDSLKNKSKSRGFVYEKAGKYIFRCHNCEKGTTLRNLIKFVDPSLEKEYLLETFSELRGTKRVNVEKRVASIPKFKESVVKLDLPTIHSLPDDHIAKKYILSRNIPEYAHKLLFYSEDFRDFCNKSSDVKLDKTSKRIVIPFFSASGELLAFQGRALDEYSMRYITIKVNKDHEKVFGLDRVNKKEKILVTEGPIDSLFLPNAIATADSNLASVASLFDKDNLILVPDNERRNDNIVKNIEKYINTGFSVCLFPESIREKDINDMVLSGLTKEEITSIIYSYTYSGLRAKLEFIRWRKI